jgi:hypothetical protein
VIDEFCPKLYAKSGTVIFGGASVLQLHSTAEMCSRVRQETSIWGTFTDFFFFLVHNLGDMCIYGCDAYPQAKILIHWRPPLASTREP